MKRTERKNRIIEIFYLCKLLRSVPLIKLKMSFLRRRSSSNPTKNTRDKPTKTLLIVGDNDVNKAKIGNILAGDGSSRSCMSGDFVISAGKNQIVVRNTCGLENYDALLASYFAIGDPTVLLVYDSCDTNSIQKAEQMMTSKLKGRQFILVGIRDPRLRPVMQDFQKTNWSQNYGAKASLEILMNEDHTDVLMRLLAILS